MDVAILSVVSAVALGLAGALALRWGRLRVEHGRASDDDDTPSASVMVRRYLRSLAIAVVSGAIAGPLVLGLGGRLAMRITAATSGDGAQGTATDAEEIVGEITFGGTVGLVIFVGLFGGFLGGLVYMGLRRFLPGPAWRAGMVVGLLGLAVFGRLAALDPDSIDFEILTPRWLTVVPFVLLAPLFGIVLAAVAERLDRSYPLLAARPGPIVAHLPLLALAAGLPILALLVAGGVLAATAPKGLRRAWRSVAVERGGQVLLAAVLAVGLTWVGTGVADIVSS